MVAANVGAGRFSARTAGSSFGMDRDQLERMERVVERKKERAQAASEEQQSLVEDGRPQDVRDPRKKNSGKGKKTADKWNQ